MALPRDLVSAVRALDESDLRRLLILARGLLLDTEVPVVQIDDVPGMPSVRYRQKVVRCNKPTCRQCPHGPYWYAHWHEDGRKRSQYIGSDLPADVRRKLEALDAADEARVDAEAAGVEEAVGQSARPAGDGRPALRIVR